MSRGILRRPGAKVASWESRLVARIRDIAAEGCTAQEIAVRAGVTAAEVRRICKQKAIPLGGAKPPLSAEEVARDQADIRRAWANGPVMGLCRRCRTWRQLADGRVKPHAARGGECAGSRMRPVPREEEP